jgi:hypothetical protein
MANDFTGNPWIIDTVMASAYPFVVFIQDLTWDEQTAGGDQLVIKRKNGNLIIDTKASAANASQRFGRVDHVEGFQVTTLGSGKVMVFIK